MKALLQRVFLMLAALVVAAGAHAAGAPVVHVNITSKPPHLVGQQLTLQVEILVPNFFMSAPKWPVLTIPGAVATLSEGASSHTSATIAGQDYAGITQTYLIVAQQEGNFTLPQVVVPFDYAAEPGKKTAGSVTLPALKFSVKLPPGAAAAAAGGAASGVMASMPVARVTLTQTLDHDAAALKTLKVGDTLTRTVVAYAANTQAMMIPPPHFDAPAGVRVYPADPVLADERQDRVGFVGGRRTDRVTYLFEKPGEVKLPAIEVGWFNAAANKREVAQAPQIVVTVAPNAGWTPAIAPAAASASGPAVTASRVPSVDWRRWLSLALGAIVMLALVAWALRRWLPRWRARRAARRQQQATSEEAAFAALEAACRRGDAAVAYASIRVWLRRYGATSVAEMSARMPQAGFQHQVAALERHLYGAEGTNTWDAAALQHAIHMVSKEWRTPSSDAGLSLVLAPLNPASAS